MPWQQLTVTTDKDVAPLISDELEKLGALSVTLQDAADQAMYELAPDESRIWQQTRVTGLFDADFDLRPVERRMHQLTAGQEATAVELSTLPDQVWERAWLDDFRPMQFGPGFWVCSSEHAIPDDAGTILRLDPGLAFGTGTHPTTALCLEWLARHRGRHASLFDFGCGSGILAIAGLLLGCKQAVAIDIDPRAIETALENARVNGVDDRLAAYSNEGYPKQPHPLVVANILAGPLVELSGAVGELVSPRGDLLLSGILQEQADDVVAAYADRFECVDRLNRQEWVCLHLRRKD